MNADTSSTPDGFADSGPRPETHCSENDQTKEMQSHRPSPGVKHHPAATIPTHHRTLQRITTAVVAPALAVGLGFAALALSSAPPALSEPTTECSPMAHPPADLPDAGTGNPLTRPGQLGGLNQGPQSDGPMQMECPDIGHG